MRAHVSRLRRAHMWRRLGARTSHTASPAPPRPPSALPVVPCVDREVLAPSTFSSVPLSASCVLRAVHRLDQQSPVHSMPGWHDPSHGRGGVDSVSAWHLQSRRVGCVHAVRPGTFSNSIGSHVCQACSAGTEYQVAGASACDVCPMPCPTVNQADLCTVASTAQCNNGKTAIYAGAELLAGTIFRQAVCRTKGNTGAGLRVLTINIVGTAPILLHRLLLRSRIMCITSRSP